MAAFNEDKVIEEKIKGILKSNYPSHQLEIVIGSDASIDQTSAIVKRLAESDQRIRFFDFQERRGKPSVINELVAHANNPILVLTSFIVLFKTFASNKLLIFPTSVS